MKLQKMIKTTFFITFIISTPAEKKLCRKVDIIVMSTLYNKFLENIVDRSKVCTKRCHKLQFFPAVKN